MKKKTLTAKEADTIFEACAFATKKIKQDPFPLSAVDQPLAAHIFDSLYYLLKYTTHRVLVQNLCLALSYLVGLDLSKVEFLEKKIWERGDPLYR